MQPDDAHALAHFTHAVHHCFPAGLATHTLDRHLDKLAEALGPGWCHPVLKTSTEPDQRTIIQLLVAYEPTHSYCTCTLVAAAAGEQPLDLLPHTIRLAF